MMYVRKSSRAYSGTRCATRNSNRYRVRGLDSDKMVTTDSLSEDNDAIAIVDEHEQSTKDILVQLINRIRQLQTDLIRLDTLFRTMYNLRPDERRINRKDNED